MRGSKMHELELADICLLAKRISHLARLSSQILHVNVGTQSHVVGEIPAVMVRVFIDHDLIGIPEPVAAETDVWSRDAEEEAAKAKALWTSSGKSPDMARPKTAGKATMFKGTIEMIRGVVSARVMADPFVVRVHVRSFRVSGFIGETSIRLSSWRSRPAGWLRNLGGRGTVSGNVSSTGAAITAALRAAFFALRKRGDEKQCERCESQSRFLQVHLHSQLSICEPGGTVCTPSSC